MRDIIKELVKLSSYLKSKDFNRRFAEPTQNVVRNDDKPANESDGGNTLENKDLEDLGFNDMDTNYDKLRSPYFETDTGEDDEEVAEKEEEYGYTSTDYEKFIEKHRDQSTAVLEAVRVDNIIKTTVDALVIGLRDGMAEGKDQFTFTVKISDIPWKELDPKTLARFDKYKPKVTQYVQEIDPKIKEVDYQIEFSENDMYLIFVVNFSP